MSLRSALSLSRAPAFAFAAVGLAWGCIAAMAPVLKAAIGVDDATYGLLLLGTAIGLSTTMVAAPQWERLTGRMALPLGTLLLAVAILGPALAGGAPAFFVALTVLGALSGLTDVVMNARVSRIEAASGRSLMNLNHGVFSAAYAVSALATGAMREAGWGIGAIFAVTAVMIAATAPWQLIRALPPEEESVADASGLPAGLLLVCGGIVLIAFMTEATVESWSALHLERTLGGSAGEGALGPAMLGLTMAVGRFSGQGLTARFDELSVIRTATAMAMAGALVAAAAPGPVVAYLGFGLMGLGVSVIGPMGLALTGRLAPPDRRTAAIARVAVIAFAGFFIAPAAMGVISEAAGLRAAFACVAAMAALVLPLSWSRVVSPRAGAPIRR